MKKDYEKPLAEIVEFLPEDNMMNDDFGIGGGPQLGGSGVGDDEDW
jgi:hypothetical protein